MGKAIIAIIVIVILAVGGWAIFGRGNKNNTGTPPANSQASTNANTPNNAAQASTANSVNIVNTSFRPSQITVAKGAKVTWTNNDSMAHTVTADNNMFNSGTLNPGQSFSFTFNQTGSFPYHCNFHSSMHGTVVVR